LANVSVAQGTGAKIAASELRLDQAAGGAVGVRIGDSRYFDVLTEPYHAGAILSRSNIGS